MKEFQEGFISELDTAITKETNIENLHAKIKYLNNQLNLKKYELKQLTNKFNLVNEKFDEIIYEWRSSSDIPRSYISGMYQILGREE